MAKIKWTEKVDTFCNIAMALGTISLVIIGLVGLNLGREIRNEVRKNNTVGINQPLNIETSVSTLLERNVNKSSVIYSVPKENYNNNKTFNTTCFIVSNEKGKTRYEIDELNLTTPALELNEAYNFSCNIKGKEVSKALVQ